MQNKVDHPLQRVSLRVLEEWGMMLTDQIDKDQAGFDPDERVYRAWIDVEGSVQGALSIFAQAEFICALTSNLLGLDPSTPPSDEECEDALREMGNVLAGNYFTEAYGEDVVFDLTNPTVSEVPFTELEKVGDRRVKYYFRADDAPVVVTFSIRE